MAEMTLGAQYYGPEAVPLLRVQLLGGFRVERTDVGSPISSWQRRSAKSLAKLLAVDPRHALHREQVLEILWPGADMESALNSFGKALHAARHALEPGLPRRHVSAYLHMVDSMVVLNTERVTIDADNFELLAADALRRQEIASYESALAAYCGELLPEDRYESWCAERRVSLVELRIQLMLGVADILERRGAYNETADQLREVLREDATLEAVHRRLMRLYVGMGIPDQAVRQYHLCQEILRRELDIAVQPETISLYRQIIADRVPERSARTEDHREEAQLRYSPSVGTGTRSPFVGRRRVIHQMRDQLAQCEDARPRMLVVSGEAGVGKTRLLEEFASQAREQGIAVLSGGGGAHASHFTCGPFAVALEDYAASRPEDERAELARMYPVLTQFVPSLMTGNSFPVLGGGAHDYYLDLIPSVVRFLTDLARTQPVLLVLGDLNESDPVSLDLIRYLAHLAFRIPLLMVGALRSPEIEPDIGLRQMIEAMTRERLWLRIDLRCLSRHACDELVRAMLPDSMVREDVLAEIYAQSRGNPLFIREVVRVMSQCRDASQAVSDRRELPALAGRPESRTSALTGMRLALMDDPLRRVLEMAAAVSSAEISLGQLCAAASALEPPLTVPVLFDALDRALRMRLLEEGKAGYTFRHPIVRAALYDGLPRHRRDQVHAALVGAKFANIGSTERGSWQG